MVRGSPANLRLGLELARTWDRRFPNTDTAAPIPSRGCGAFSARSVASLDFEVHFLHQPFQRVRGRARRLDTRYSGNVVSGSRRASCVALGLASCTASRRRKANANKAGCSGRARTPACAPAAVIHGLGHGRVGRHEIRSVAPRNAQVREARHQLRNIAAGGLMLHRNRDREAVVLAPEKSPAAFRGTPR